MTFTVLNDQSQLVPNANGHLDGMVVLTISGFGFFQDPLSITVPVSDAKDGDEAVEIALDKAAIGFDRFSTKFKNYVQAQKEHVR